MHSIALAKGISFRILPPLPPSAPAGSSGSDSRRERQLRIAAAACRRRAGRYPSAAALEQPSGAICRKDGLRQATRDRRKLVFTQVEARRQELQSQANQLSVKTLELRRKVRGDEFYTRQHGRWAAEEDGQ